MPYRITILALICSGILGTSHLQSQSWKQNSVLSQGRWIKIGLEEPGVYKIGYEDLVNFGIDPAQLDWSTLGVFGNPTGMLPESNNTARPDGLQELAIYTSGDEDNRFDPGDYIAFFAEGIRDWNYSIFTGDYWHKNNYYDSLQYFFLTPDQGNCRKIETSLPTELPANQTSNGYTDYQAHELDQVSLILSGKEWYGEEINQENPYFIKTFDFPNRDEGAEISIKARLKIRSSEESSLSIYVNNVSLVNQQEIKAISGYNYARNFEIDEKIFVEGNSVEVRIEYSAPLQTSRAWLDYISVHVRSELRYNNKQLLFRDLESINDGGITSFEMSNPPIGLLLWDVTHPTEPKNVVYQRHSTLPLLSFVYETQQLREFVAFETSQLKSVISHQKISNQNLHNLNSPDYLIISHSEFTDQANRLAHIHEEQSDLEVLVVDPDHIYNEFSTGRQDITAIRDFVRMLYLRGNKRLRYLLLFGDASYDYLNRVEKNTNFVPTYEADESLDVLLSFVSDDYFGLMDVSEGNDCNGNVDIGIGRFPVANQKDAALMVDKVEHYIKRGPATSGPWKNRICFIADDEDQNTHLDQAQQLVSIIDTVSPQLNINKVYIDAYKQVAVPGGKRYPEAQEAIASQISDGALIMNYTGHGGLLGWADEMILDVPTINQFTNYDQLPLFITATCEFSRFDNPNFLSPGEMLLLNEQGGAIAMLTTTREAYSLSNLKLNRRIYLNFFDDETQQVNTLGDLTRISKTPGEPYILNFALLGDPALRLSYPELKVVTSHINNIEVELMADTVRALDKIKVKGYISQPNRDTATYFNGILNVSLFDKPSVYFTNKNDQGSRKTSFELMDSDLFAGNISITKGTFEFEMLIPKNINYQNGLGKLSYFAMDTTNWSEASGTYNELMIGGYNSLEDVDFNGPDMELYIENDNFVNGSEVPSQTSFLARLSDPSGINFVGHGIGHDMVFVLDENWQDAQIVNTYYQVDMDTYQSGWLEFPLPKLETGMHTAYLKSWDNANNSSEQTIEFYVNELSQIQVYQVENYPNPASSYTYFRFNHNKFNEEVNVNIRVYSIDGVYVKNIEQTVNSSSGQIEPIYWDTTNESGQYVAGGMYVYSIWAEDKAGNTMTQSGKLSIQRN